MTSTISCKLSATEKQKLIAISTENGKSVNQYLQQLVCNHLDSNLCYQQAINEIVVYYITEKRKLIEQLNRSRPQNVFLGSDNRKKTELLGAFIDNFSSYLETKSKNIKFISESDVK